MLNGDFSHADVLSLWKGARYLSRMAADIGVPKHRVRRWLLQGNISPEYWPQLIEAVRTRFDIEITTDQLTAAAVRAAEESGKQLREGQDTEAA